MHRRARGKYELEYAQPDFRKCRRVSKEHSWLAHWPFHAGRLCELKWYTHAKGETRPEWAPGNPVKTVNILIRGHFDDRGHDLTMLISGSCHCGNISFVLDWQPEPAQIPARACTCSFCIKHGGVWTSCAAGSLIVRTRQPARAAAYAFGTKTAQFHVCTNCGIVPVVTSHIDGKVYAVVSVNAFDNVDPALLQRGSATFDGEGAGDRLARRQRNWIGQVVFEQGA